MTTETAQNKGWIAVDFDGTLATYDPVVGVAELGDAIDPMLFRVRQWLEAGIEVRIFTARASDEQLVAPVQQWLADHTLPDNLLITNKRDKDCLQVWDDRVIQVETNTAEMITPKEHMTLSVSGWIGVELDGVLAHYTPEQEAGTIGEPIGKMRMRVQQLLMTGMDVRVFSGRAADSAAIPLIQEWLNQHQLQEMKITCEKDFMLSQFWDDRGVHVIHNRGDVAGSVNQLIPERKYPAR